jgi:hypothetical protein
MSQIAIGLSIFSLLALASLHVLSSEINPVWHMVSEYAFGEYGWVLSIFFFAWGLCSWATAFAIIPFAKNWTSKLSVFLLFVTGLGAIMGGLFDVRHPLHGMAFALGVPFFPIAALLSSRYVRKNYGVDDSLLRISAHAPWVTLILMGIAMWLFISGLKAAGAFRPDVIELITTLPEGVTAFHGIPNRLLVISYLGWLIVINRSLLQIRGMNKSTVAPPLKST